MRLIDADKLIEKIWKLHEETEKQYDLCVDELKDMYCGVVSLIDAQPTTYDVDAVVEQLKKNGQKMSEAKPNKPDGESSPGCHNYYKAISVKKAIGIVKGGGVDAKTDS